MRDTATTLTRRDSQLGRDVLRWWIFLAAVISASSLVGQDRPSTNKEEELPKPRPVKFTTKDGVEIRAAYYPSNQKKEAIPILVVHDWKGQASPYYELCIRLQESGFAVLVPEYRGHGGSRDYVDRRGQTKRFNIARMSKRDVESIIMRDLESAKGFLKEENNDGKLNLNALVIIGVEEGAVLAAQWAMRDWKFPSIGRKKQGQDVKALIYLSPAKQIKGVGIDPTLGDRDLIKLPTMIVAGKGSREANETERIAKQIEGQKRRMNRGTAVGFELLTPDTSLSGHRLINDVPAVATAIIEFIEKQVKVSDEENAWIDRI